jgi:hypothetical protein
MSDEIPTVRWCVQFKTTDGKSSWMDQLAKHPAGAKRATIDELDRMGYEVAEFGYVTRTDAIQSRAAMRIQWRDTRGLFENTLDALIGHLFDKEREKA